MLASGKHCGFTKIVFCTNNEQAWLWVVKHFLKEAETARQLDYNASIHQYFMAFLLALGLLKPGNQT